MIQIFRLETFPISAKTLPQSSSLTPLIATNSVSKTVLISAALFQVQIEGIRTQNTVRRDRAHSPAAVSVLRLNSERPLVTRAHVQQSLIPALDDLSLANVEVQWLTAVVGCVEFAAVGGESAAVVD